MALTPPAPESGPQFAAWMQEQAFTNDTLAAALQNSRATVWKWATGRHPIDYVTWLACLYVAGTEADRRRREASLAEVEAVRTESRERERAARNKAHAAAIGR